MARLASATVVMVVSVVMVVMVVMVVLVAMVALVMLVVLVVLVVLMVLVALVALVVLIVLIVLVRVSEPPTKVVVWGGASAMWVVRDLMWALVLRGSVVLVMWAPVGLVLILVVMWSTEKTSARVCLGSQDLFESLIVSRLLLLESISHTAVCSQSHRHAFAWAARQSRVGCQPAGALRGGGPRLQNPTPGECETFFL